MGRTRYAAWLLGLWLLTLPTEGFGGAWTLRPGAVYLELFSQGFWADAAFDAAGRRRSTPNAGSFYEIREELKAEVGVLTPRLNLRFELPVETAHFQDRNVSLGTSGVEEMRLGMKYRFTPEPTPVVISAQLTGTFPACDADAQPPLADCQFAADMRLIFSKGLWPHPDTGISRVFVSLEGGYWYRAGPPADELPYYFEAGVNVWKFVWGKVTLDGVESRPFGGGMEEDFHKWTAALLLSKDPAQRTQHHIPGLELGYGEVYAGKNTGAGRVLFLKLFYQF
jgi:hypothetical protein